MPQNIQDVEIFATGKHMGSEVINITDNDLQEMVNSFNELQGVGGFQPVLKLGHDDVQKFFGARKGAPNLGFVEKLRIEGSKILADFSNIPDALFDLIKQRRFNSVSIEMFPKTEFNGKQFKNVLTAVALLGAELPAVKGLKDLAATLFTEEIETGFLLPGDKIELKEQDMPFSQEQVDTLIDAAVAKAKDEAKAEFTVKLDAVTTERDDAIKGKETAQESLRTFEADIDKHNATAMVDKAIKEGKLLPVQKDPALAFAMNVSGTIKMGDKETSASKLFSDFIDSLPTKVDLSERGQGGTDEKFTSAADQIDALAKAKVAASPDGKMDYATARKIVLDEDEDLKARYINVED